MIAGLQKMTLLDYPGKVACTLFLRGCNFRCPFCHNSGLLSGAGEESLPVEAFLQFLGKRKGILDGVCVTGGEPTLQPGLEDLLRQIKDLGFSVKLDTNGSRPAVLKRLVAEKLVDYVAMDVKNGPDAYDATVGVPALHLESLEESLRFLMEGNVDYELRTTVVAQLHSEASVLQMGQWLASLAPGKKPEKLFLQFFTDRESVLLTGLSAHDTQTMEKLANLLSPYIGKVSLRGG